MGNYEELSSRIMAAMDRVAQRIDTFENADLGKSEALEKALEEERQVNAELSERVKVLGERQEHALAAMEAKAAEAVERMNALDTEMQQLRKANEMLAEASQSLRDANAEGVGDPDLINGALTAELESIRAMRRAEIAEADEIMAGLMPLLNASEQAATSEGAQ